VAIIYLMGVAHGRRLAAKDAGRLSKETAARSSP
jgi:hypothetical protein